MSTASICRPSSLIIVALALAACRDDSTGVPASLAARLVTDDAPQFSDWSTPVNLGSVVNSPSADIEVSISTDGLSLYLASNRPGGFGSSDIWVSQRASVDDPWGAPQNLGLTINTPAREQAPFLSLDGHRLYFFSDRPGGFGGTDLYVSRRRDKRDDFGWQSPENLGSNVNSAFNENLSVYFEHDATGAVTLYFNSNKPGGLGATDIYASTLQPDETFGPVVWVGELSSSAADAAVAIRRDGLELFLASGRTPKFGVGAFDLLVATRANTSDPWSTPVNLGPLVNVADDARAALSFDATTLYIISDRPGGFGGLDVWVSTRSRLKEPD